MNAIERAGREVTRGDEPGTDPEHDGVGDAGEELHEREIDGDEPLGGHPRLEVVASQALETA